MEKITKQLFSIGISFLKKSPDYLPAHLQIARTYSKMDPDYKMGLAKGQIC